MNSETNVLALVEHETRRLPRSEFTHEYAHRLYPQFKDKIAVDWPSPKTEDCWQLTSQGWVGFIPLEEQMGISLQPKIALGNLFQMLEHAYDLPSFTLLSGSFDCQSMRDFYERIADILALRLLARARRGLYKTYKSKHERLSYIRGRIDTDALARQPVKTPILCRYEDHTIDIEDNQIVAWTLFTILRSGNCSERTMPVLRKAERALRHSVSLTRFDHSDCTGRHYSRLNDDYEILHKLCRFFLENTGPSQNFGKHSMIPFLVDMGKLFELFVARWLAKHLDGRYSLRIQESYTIGYKSPLRMLVDLVIFDREMGRPLCVLDTKYKAHGSVSNEDYNQVVAYADAVGCANAVLIYPGELEHPIDEKPGNIRVTTAAFDIGGDLDQMGTRLLNRLYEVLSIY